MSMSKLCLAATSCSKSPDGDNDSNGPTSAVNRSTTDLQAYLEMYPPPSLQEARKPRTELPSTRDQYQFSLLQFLLSTVGKDLTKVPMPVFFNEPLSFLQRLTEDVGYAHLLNKAADCGCSVDRLAYIAAFASSAFASVPGRFWKPFNPLLGETFEYYNSEHQYHVIAEQISHHPPVSAIHIESEKWIFWEEYRLDTRFKGNYVKVCPTGVVHVRMKSNGHHYSWRKPNTRIHNIIIGTLWADHDGLQTIHSHQTGEEADVVFTRYSKHNPDYKQLTGCVRDACGDNIYTLQGNWEESMEALPVEGSNRQPIDLWRASSKPENSASYFGFTKFAMDLNEVDETVTCPTDSRHRPDQRLLENGLVDEAGKDKYRLEEKQRSTKKTRDHDKQAWKPVWFSQEVDADTKCAMYFYKGGYWSAKAEGKYPMSPDIF